jgi:hypothetical protein
MPKDGWRVEVIDSITTNLAADGITNADPICDYQGSAPVTQK